MAESGGVRAWKFFKRNPGFRAAFEARPREASLFEDAPYLDKRLV